MSRPVDKIFPQAAREASIQERTCVQPPFGCGNPVVGFADAASAKEYGISGMCQACQDKFWGATPGAKRTYYFKKDLNLPGGRFDDPGMQTTEENANLISSRTILGTHRPVIDIDLPIKAVESTTSGHYHLYIEKELTHGQYDLLLQTMRDVGLVEPGFYNAFKAKGMTMVRKPGEKKPPGAPPSSGEPPPSRRELL